jgi:predicted dehydrogenase
VTGPHATGPDVTGPLGVAVVGAGYWGPNLARNFAAHPGTTLRWVCDRDLERAERVAGPSAGVRPTADLDDVLDDPAVVAVAVATPASTHVEIALDCIAAGKHLLMEKPLATNVADGTKIVEAAEDAGVVLMCDHTYCYTPAVRHIRRLVQDGTLGAIQYLDSVRVNLGLVQPDVDVFWDLAPHDLSILDAVLPPSRAPRAVAAHGADPLGTGRLCIGYLALPLAGGAIAHVHVNWLSPTKIRRTIVGGSDRMVVWDDLDPARRLSMYDRGVELRPVSDEDRHRALVSYRIGDMVAPTLPEVEALQEVVAELVRSIRERRPPLTDGRSGLRVLRILEGVSTSLALDGAPVQLEEAP